MLPFARPPAVVAFLSRGGRPPAKSRGGRPHRLLRPTPTGPLSGRRMKKLRSTEAGRACASGGGPAPRTGCDRRRAFCLRFAGTGPRFAAPAGPRRGSCGPDASQQWRGRGPISQPRREASWAPFSTGPNGPRFLMRRKTKKPRLRGAGRDLGDRKSGERATIRGGPQAGW